MNQLYHIFPYELDNDPWIEVELEASGVETGSIKGSGPVEGVIALLGDKQNRIAIGRPYFQKLNLKSKQATPEVKKLMETNDFHLVSLSCSFLPDMDCKFTWAQLGVLLEANDKQGTSLSAKPIAWNLFPEEVTSPVDYTNGLSISPELSFNAGGLATGAKLFSVTSEKRWISYQPQLFSFGYRTSSIAWQFRETAEKDVRGDARDLMIIIQSPQESRIKGEFKLSAEVAFQGATWRLSKSKRDNIQDQLDLSS